MPLTTSAGRSSPPAPIKIGFPLLESQKHEITFLEHNYNTSVTSTVYTAYGTSLSLPSHQGGISVLHQAYERETTRDCTRFPYGYPACILCHADLVAPPNSPSQIPRVNKRESDVLSKDTDHGTAPDHSGRNEASPSTANEPSRDERKAQMTKLGSETMQDDHQSQIRSSQVCQPEQTIAELTQASDEQVGFIDTYQEQIFVLQNEAIECLVANKGMETVLCRLTFYNDSAVALAVEKEEEIAEKEGEHEAKRLKIIELEAGMAKSSADLITPS